MCLQPTSPVLDRELQYGVRSVEVLNRESQPYSQQTRSVLKKTISLARETNMAELAGLPIPSMDWHSPDAPQAFKKFKARCELNFSGPLKEKSEEEQISYPGDDVSNWFPRGI